MKRSVIKFLTSASFASAVLLGAAAAASAATTSTCNRSVISTAASQTKFSDVVRYCCQRTCVGNKCWCSRWCATGGGGTRG